MKGGYNMAKKPRITKAQQRILDKYSYIRETWQQPDYKPRYGKGSRQPTTYNIIQKSVSQISKDYVLKKGERLQLRGMTRRLTNLQKLVKTNTSIANTFEKRWALSDAKEEFGYKNFSDLTAEELGQLIELYVAKSGVMMLPSLNTPDPDKTTVKWDS